MSNGDGPGAPDLIYLDNAATSFPKPPAVGAAMVEWLNRVGGSPGRSGHRLSSTAARMVFETRETLARLLGVASSRRIVFTKHATEALNLAIHGVLSPGDRAVVTSMEHNSVMRPLRYLAAARGIDLAVVPCSGDGRLPLDRFEAALEPATRLAVVTHASNVCGTLMPVADVARICRREGTMLLLDAAQTAGCVPIDFDSLGIDLMAFTGHKGLLGPTGTGGLCLREGVAVRPLMQGGTGSRSEHEEQPDFLPDSLEAGTLNAVGLAGLKAGIDFILETGLERVREKEVDVTDRLLRGLAAIPGVTIQGPGDAREMTAVISVSFEGLAPSEVGFLLDEGFGILTRVGLHCSPAAHRTMGTFPAGTVRLAPGYFTTPGEIDRCLEAFESVARRRLP